MIFVTYFSRKKGLGFSIERVFKDVAENLPNYINATFCYNRFESRGVFRRLFDLFRASLHQGQINHITGDVHYISYLLRKDKTILTIHDCGTLRCLNGLKRSFFYFFWIWLPCNRCRFLVAISESTRDEILHLIPGVRDRIRVIHNPVSSEFKSSPKHFNKSRPRILHLGGAPNKNLERHAAALRDFACELFVVGQISAGQRLCLENSGICYTVLEKLSSAALLEQYLRSDIVLFASTYEGFGLPIVEAQAVGRPVVTSNLPPMTEVAADAACFVNPYDVPSIRAGIARLIHDEDYRNALVASGYRNVKRFEPRRIAAQYAQLYQEILAAE